MSRSGTPRTCSSQKFPQTSVRADSDRLLPRTLVVIPTYNERDCVQPIVAAVRASTPEATILVVDDNSPDGTGALADELAAADPQVRVLHRTGKEGLGAAYLHAFRVALEE